jgi:hypothetical protein
MRHTVYVQSLVRLRDGQVWTLVMLTTTSERMVSKIPEGLALRVSDAASRRMGMRRSFAIDIHRMALLPLAIAWFPDMESASFIIGRADTGLQAAVARRYQDMLTRALSARILLGPKI